MGKVAVIGMVGNSAFLSVDQFHRAGETVAAKQIHFEPGGKGFNQAVAAARFGADVSFLGAVGVEHYEQIASFLKEDGIKSLLPRKNASTAYAVILTDAEGANQVTVYQGARLTPEDVDAYEPEIAQADVLILNNEVPENVNIRAVELAKRYGTFVILNPAPAVKLHDSVIRGVDLFTPNEHEMLGLESVENLIVTLGSKGCYVKALDTTVDALAVDVVVDTTGAGDTFNGVLAAELADKKQLISAVQMAVAASGVSVTRPFAATAIPFDDEVYDYLENCKPKTEF